MRKLLGILILGILAVAALAACAGNNSQQIPYAPYATANCLPGQLCATGGPVSPFSAASYIHYSGEIGNINSGVARSMIDSAYNVISFCWPNCYNYSTIDVILNPSTNGSAGQATINIGGYPIGGQAFATPSNGGTDVQVTAFGAGRIDIITTNFPLDGSVNAIPNVNVQYNGQNLGTASLMRAAF